MVLFKNVMVLLKKKTKEIEPPEENNVRAKNKEVGQPVYLTTKAASEREESEVYVGIDLGTNSLLIYVQGHGIIFNEPSVVAFDVASGRLIAGGNDAFQMLGKVHDKIRVTHPLRDGVISDMCATKALLIYAFERIKNFQGLRNAICVICCPSEVTQIERDAMKQLAIDMEVKEIYVEQEIKAGAIGSGANIYGPEATMVVDIGGGTTDVGVLSLGDVVTSQTIRVAGNYIDAEIVKYVHKQHNLVIGLSTAEQIKKTIGTLVEGAPEKFMDVSGRELFSGFPTDVPVSSRGIQEVMLTIFYEIASLIKLVLETTPPELSSDLVENGIVLEGGGSLIPGVVEFLEREVGLPIYVCESPITAVVMGTKSLLKNRGSYLVNPEDC